MKFEKFQKVKNDIEKLPNVLFYSFNEDTVIIQHKKNEALYQIPFTEEIDESVTLHLGAGKKVKEGKLTVEEEFKQNSANLRDSIKSIFTNYDEGIKNLKKLIADLPNVDSEEIAKRELVKEKTYEESIEEYASSHIKPVKNINSTFKRQLVEFNKTEQDFVQLFHIFNEDGTLKKHDLNYELLKTYYNESLTEYKEFCAKLDKMNGFVDSIKDIAGDDVFAEDIIRYINFEQNLKVTVPKAVVSAQREYGENVNVIDISKKIMNVYSEIFKSDEENPIVFNRHRSGSDERIPQFLKFHTNKYQRNDVETLEHELEQSIYSLKNISDEDLREIGKWKNQCTYMSRTGIVSDKKVDEIIKSFNEKYAKDSSEEFNDGDESVGYKEGPAEMKDATGAEEGLADEETRRSESEYPDKDIEIEEPEEEEEKLETVEVV